MRDDGAILAFLIVVLVSLAIIFGGAAIAHRKNRSAVGWGVACLFFGWIAFLILVLLPKVQKPSPLTIPVGAPPPAYDAAKWDDLLKRDANVAASAAKLRPYGDRYVAFLASTVLSGQRDLDLAVLTDDLIAKAKVDAAAAERAIALDTAELRTATLYEAAGGVVVARLDDGRAMAKIGNEWKLFESPADYRDWSNDREAWQEIKKPA